MEILAANAGNSGDIDIGAIAGTKLGETATGVRLGDLGIGGTKLGNTKVDAMKLGDAGVVVAAAISGDTDFFGMLGRKFGDVANESVRFDAEREKIRLAMMCRLHRRRGHSPACCSRDTC